jgi:hypothetical protein
VHPAAASQANGRHLKPRESQHLRFAKDDRWEQGISEILTSAVGVAIGPGPIIAIILTLFSERARVNGRRRRLPARSGAGDRSSASFAWM